GHRDAEQLGQIYTPFCGVAEAGPGETQLWLEAGVGRANSIQAGGKGRMQKHLVL
ncbi:hypothetical protein E2320_000269, partial [Naja naja]